MLVVRGKRKKSEARDLGGTGKDDRCLHGSRYGVRLHAATSAEMTASLFVAGTILRMDNVGSS